MGTPLCAELATDVPRASVPASLTSRCAIVFSALVKSEHVAHDCLCQSTGDKAGMQVVPA
jgi:hypothetical protein